MTHIMIKLGIDMLLEQERNLIKGKRVGILAHAASLGAAGVHTVDRLGNMGDVTIGALFGPEHGITTAAQDMEPVASGADDGSVAPIYSLYGNTLDSLKPTREMLSKIDVLVIDLQDIGSRYYTYIWTACLCIEACAEEKKTVIVCDRPNPIGGIVVEGGEIIEGYQSFVGLHSMPVRHGMTIGEIVQFMNDKNGIGADLKVIKMSGWKRGMSWNDTGLKWTNPSPNMRSYTAALLYPGMCLIEGTNLSEGRGTDTPFELVGAPYVDAKELVAALNSLGLPGVLAAPTAFIPTMQKWYGQICNGVRWVISDVAMFRPYLTGLAFVWLCNRLYKDKGFEWRTAPYEFVTTRPAIDLLTGSSVFREGIDGFSIEDLKKLSSTPKAMVDERKRYLVY